MWFKRKRDLFNDPKTIEWCVGEIAVIRQQIEELKNAISTLQRHNNSLRGIINKKLGGFGETTPDIDGEARKFYESTVEYAEMNKALNKTDS